MRPYRGAGTMKAPVTGILMLVAGAQLFAQKPTLTPDDYIAIQQLVSKYAYAIDECTNRGYDYADLYVPDGTFSTSRNGKVLNTFAGRDRLAEAARGGMPDCKDVPWAGIVHMLVNHVIEPAPGGATGKVYLIAIGLDGEPGKVEAQGRYEDVYVKTPQGWRFKSRMHVLAAGRPRCRVARSSPIKTHGLTHVALAVRDPQRSMRFYQDVVGAVAVYRATTSFRCRRRAAATSSSSNASRVWRGSQAAWCTSDSVCSGRKTFSTRRTSCAKQVERSRSAASSSPASRTCTSTIPMATRSRSGTRFRRSRSEVAHQETEIAEITDSHGATE